MVWMVRLSRSETSEFRNSASRMGAGKAKNTCRNAITRVLYRARSTSGSVTIRRKFSRPTNSDPVIPRNGEKSWKARSEEHTSELQSRFDLVCRLLLEKKKEE